MPDSKTIIVGTRKSLLAMTQAEGVISCLKKLFPDYKFLIKKITTEGDRLKNWATLPTKGIFVKEIEELLISAKIDLAVHSMKDLPCEIPEQLKIAAVTKRLDPKDVLISRSSGKLNVLKTGSCIGTSSLRRKTQLLAYRSDFRIADIRGNLDTRLKKMKKGRYDAIVVAAAGILRLGWEEIISEFISPKIVLPAPGQGALGIEVRKDDRRVEKIAKKLNHEITRLEVTAERAFLAGLGGGCRTPIAALGKVKGSRLKLEGSIASGDGESVLRSSLIGDARFPERLGLALAKQIKGD